MKIQYALMTCSAHPRYVEYWPVAAKAWLKLGITPVCLFIPDNQNYKLPPAPGGIVHTIPPLEDVHIIIQTFMLRFWASYLYPDAVVTTSDIDLIPLSKHFFCTRLIPYPEEAYIHLWPKNRSASTTISNIPEKITHLEGIRHVQSCLHTAKGKIMHKMLEFSSDWETSCKKTIPYFLHDNSRIKISTFDYQGSAPWGGDDIYLSIRLHHSNHPLLFYDYDDQPKSLPAESEEHHKETPWFHASFPYSETKWIIERLMTKGTLPKFYVLASTFIYRAIRPNQKIGKAGDWLAWFIIVLIWFVLRTCRFLPIHPAWKIYIKIILSNMWYTHYGLRRRNPLLAKLYRQYQRLARSLFA